MLHSVLILGLFNDAVGIVRILKSRSSGLWRRVVKVEMDAATSSKMLVS